METPEVNEPEEPAVNQKAPEEIIKDLLRDLQNPKLTETALAKLMRQDTKVMQRAGITAELFRLSELEYLRVPGQKVLLDKNHPDTQRIRDAANKLLNEKHPKTSEA